MEKLAIYCLCVFGIELFLFYTPLYFIFYKLLRLDVKIGDGKLAIILVITAILLSVIFYIPMFQFIRGIVFGF